MAMPFRKIEGKPYATKGGGWNTLRSMPQECQWAARKNSNAASFFPRCADEIWINVKGGASFDGAGGSILPLKTLACLPSGGFDNRFFINCTHWNGNGFLYLHTERGDCCTPEETFGKRTTCQHPAPLNERNAQSISAKAISNCRFILAKVKKLHHPLSNIPGVFFGTLAAAKKKASLASGPWPICVGKSPKPASTP